MNILEVEIDNLSRNEILKKIEDFLNENKFHQIATVNPEFILEAQKNEKFKNIINNCALCVADGVGIFFAFLRFGKWLRCRFAGVDLMDEVLRLAQEKNLNIFLATKKDGLSTWQEASSAILKKYPKLEIGGANLDKNSDLYQMIDADYQILFCNFGAPSQEIFLDSLKNQNNARIRLAMGVGGGFDYLTGKVPRAPKFMQILGLEWLWRLILEPKYRIKRIFRAVIVFSIKIIFNK